MWDDLWLMAYTRCEYIFPSLDALCVLVLHVVTDEKEKQLRGYARMHPKTECFPTLPPPPSPHTPTFYEPLKVDDLFS